MHCKASCRDVSVCCLLKRNLNGGQAGCFISAKAHGSQQMAKHFVVHVGLRLHAARGTSHCSYPSFCSVPAAVLLCKMCNDCHH